MMALELCSVLLLASGALPSSWGTALLQAAWPGPTWWLRAVWRLVGAGRSRAGQPKTAYPWQDARTDR